ncbi:putative RNA-binding protein [Handroanthus impetiginosus]|uniref:Putative RNA-binding protein n=1 Tax=Handroanthus impetiginosus TaxID=429701 RepID=A0A2G9H8A2_9LAMI|nr:putative RNA-binding protein [Handroanthus impetiginosus]
MVSIGLKALPSRKHNRNLSQDSLIADESKSSHDKVGKKRNMGRKGSKKGGGFHADVSKENQSGDSSGASGKARNFSKDRKTSVSQASFVRKQVDPETVKYFSEIANVIEGTEVDLEERSVICGNALEEARGKEVELATDYIISHTMQTLLEGCSVDHLCSFLRSCAKKFSHISVDRSGSHVAETALKSLARHLEDDENHSLIEETVSALSEAIMVNPVDIMCNCYGSHVLRRLLCLCKGVPVDSPEFHSIKPSVVLAERLNLRSSQLDGHDTQQNEPFPDQLKFLISEMLDPSRADISILQVNQYGSLVLQTALKLLAGQEEELLRFIPVLLGCRMDNALEENFVEVKMAKKILRLVEENAFSHLMEVILAVAPDTLYNEIFTKIFKGSLFRISSHPSGNFVVQALVSHARTQEHMKLIYEELGFKFKNLLELGRAGVVAALIAASHRLQINEREQCCQALADAVHLTNEPSACIVPRILFLDNYFHTDDKDNWNWPNGAKMHVLGSLMLQAVFKFPSEFIQTYVASIISLEDNHVLEASKDPAGARVIEAFLNSNVSAKQKRKLVIKLRGHFGELSVLPSGSFTVEKCFNVSNMSLRETIVTELLPFQTELSKTKQGPYLLKKLDVEGFERRPDQWRSRQTSKESAYKEFYAAFGPKDTKSYQSGNFLADPRPKSQAEKLKGMRKEIDTHLSSGFSSNGTPFLAHQGRSTKPKKSRNKQSPESRGFHKDVDDNSFKSKSKERKTEKASSSTKTTNDGEIVLGEKLSTHTTEKKRRRKDGLSKSLSKKLKAGSN